MGSLLCGLLRILRLGELLLASQDAFNPRLHLAWGDVAVDNALWFAVASNNPRLTSLAEVLMWYWAGLGRICAQCQQYWLSWPAAVTSQNHFSSPRRGCLCPSRILPASSVGYWKRLDSQQPTMTMQATVSELGQPHLRSWQVWKDSEIQLLGRWQSAAFLRYIRTPQERLAAISCSLATPTGTPGTITLSGPSSHEASPTS